MKPMGLSISQRTAPFIRGLYIQGRERDLTESFFAYSQNIDSPESFILPFFTRKVSTVSFSEGGCTLS